MIKHDWKVSEIEDIYNLPFPELIYRAQTIHRENFPGNKIQRSTLLSIKTGGCSEDCAYCPQSSRHDTGLKREPFLNKDVVVEAALAAKAEGSTRFCMGAAWRQVKEGEQFEHVLDLVRSVAALDMEVCCTLGMLTESQAERLKEAGCYAYNHNLDTSPEYYGEIITTRTYQDRLDTIDKVRKAGITVCCGGIVGMGESVQDRLGLLQQLANQNPHPESVPVNMLIRIEGTPLAEATEVKPFEFVRIIATARIIMPKSMVRLSAGRTEMSEEMQALCFIAGANSVFAGEKLLTAPNPSDQQDRQLLDSLGMSFC
jgi:biotin synthase